MEQEVVDELMNHEFFSRFEKGEISEAEFRHEFRSITDHTLSEQEIDRVWNLMLQDIPAERIAWIEEMGEKYNIVVLSNTNSIHVRHFDEVFRKSSKYDKPADLFHRLYYSYEIKKRKPDTESFQHVLDDFGMIPERTVMFDDLKGNLETAEKLGIKTVYVERNKLRKEQLPNGKY